ncbi:MAG TPA: PLDc N-terminal domain-containing protein [bacterium]|nr:PLDc N-terminal domain-containing protein [bacterium]
MGFLIGLLVLVLDILAILQIAQARGRTTKKVLWILLILFLPVLGLILWYLLGRD